VKINTDAAVLEFDGRAAAGGLVRNHTGCCLRGFCRSLGYCLVLQAEAWGLLDGLELAWQLGYRKVEAESDNLNLICLLQDNTNADPGEALIRRILNICARP
ncbi:hypothetical protein Golob_014115, partial [Gossypium lobatum]|nr:hypothetical protein [Gossypium lobatum]